MQLWSLALVHTSSLRVPGSGTPDFDDHMVPPWCAMCPPSSAIVGVLRPRIICATMSGARPPVPHRGDAAYKNTFWLGSRVRGWGSRCGELAPDYGTVTGPITWGQVCLVEDRAKPRFGKLRAEGVQTTQAWPGLTPANIRALQSQSLRSPHPRDGRSHAL